MATKLKSSKAGKGYSPFYYISGVLIVLLFLSGITLFLATMVSISEENRSFNEIFQIKDFRESRSFMEKYDTAARQILILLERYQDEEYIRSGQAVNPEELETLTLERYEEVKGQREEDSGQETEEPAELEEDPELAGEEGISPESYADGMQNDEEVGEIPAGEPLEREPALEESPAVPAAETVDERLLAEIRQEVRQEIIKNQLRDFLRVQSDLKELGVLYYASDGTVAVTNLEGYSLADKEDPALREQFTNSGAWAILDQGQLEIQPKYDMRSFYVSQGYLSGYLEELQSQNYYNPDFCLYLSFTEEALAAEESAFLAAQQRYKGILPAAGITVLVLLILMVYQIAACGRRDEKGEIVYNWFDRLFTELHLLLLAGAIGIGGLGYISLMETAFFYDPEYAFYLPRLQVAVGIEAVLAIAIAVAAAFIGEFCILAMIKNIKGGRFWSNSLLGRIFLWLKTIALAVFQGGSMERRAVIVTFLVVSFSSLCVFLYPLTILVTLTGAVIWAKRYEKIKEGTRRVKEGELSYTIDVKKGELGRLAANINDISKGLDAAVQNRMKNERLRTELISNVSHDLKTPLTSIVSYIDLLKKEGLTSPNAPHYLDVIDRKAQRLQKLTLDLFEAAKVSSGAIQVEMGKVELRSLVDQGLGEMEDKIINSSLEFIINATDEKFYVEADGRLLWRVVENLLTNVLKYAQENSRVYIDLKRTKHQAILIIKNVSRNRLNISAEELMERFKRGDESRSTEGSGLGLAIARDLVRLQKGAFDISIDGDLFKATVILRLYPEPQRTKEKTGRTVGAQAQDTGMDSHGESEQKAELKAEKAKFGFAAGKAREVKARFQKNKEKKAVQEVVIAKPEILAEAVGSIEPKAAAAAAGLPAVSPAAEASTEAETPAGGKDTEAILPPESKASDPKEATVSADTPEMAAESAKAAPELPADVPVAAGETPPAVQAEAFAEPAAADAVSPAAVVAEKAGEVTSNPKAESSEPSSRAFSQ